MRNFKATLLLGILTSVAIFLAVTGGFFLPLDALWKGLLRFTPNDPAATELFQALLIFFFAFSMTGVGIALHEKRERFLLALLTAVLMLSGSFVLALYHFFLSPFPAEAALGVAYSLVFLYLRTASGARQPLLRRLFGERLHRPLFKKLVEGEMPLTFLGELKEGTLLVCALNNHLELMAALKPEEYVAITNLYLQTASDFLVDVGGYLEECSGETLRVVFGVPLPLEGPINHGEKAARAALDLSLRLDELNRQCDARWQQRLDFCIGIASGEMVAASYGSRHWSQYSVAGPMVELARYLCAACRTYGCRILVGPSTYLLAEKAIEFRPIDLLRRKGIRRSAELYEVLALRDTLSAERERSRDLFWKGVIFFREKKWDKAVAALTAARILGIPDKVLDLYLERIDRARRGDDELSPDQLILSESAL